VSVDVMEQLEEMLVNRKDQKNLNRETSLYDDCDNMLSELNKLKNQFTATNS